MSVKLTAAEVNALPDRVRAFIHELETICDPAGTVTEIGALKDQRDALAVAVVALRAQVELLTARVERGIEKRNAIAEDVKNLRDELGVREKNRQFRAFVQGASWPY